MEQVYLYDLSRHFPPKPPFLKIGREINRGSYGTVYEGRLGLEGRSVAVKKLHRILQEAAHDERTTALFDNFKKECVLLEKAEHVHVVQFHGAFYDEESREPLLVMERMHENLSDHLSNNRGRLSFSRQLQICLEIVEGVHFLHSLVPPVIHRDLNDKNVMLTKEGLVKVGDLGQSRLKDVNKDHFSSGQPGAVPFMPPEALQDIARYNEKIDTFSVGVLMLEVATQQSPQMSYTGIGTVPEKKRREKDLARLPGDHPLEPLILHCLRDDPEERPDMTTLMKKLQMIIESWQNKKTVEIVVKKFPGLAGLDKFIILRENLKVADSLRSNHYIDVLSGEYKGEKVEIKPLKDDHKGLEDFLAEASELTSLSHPNLTRLIAVCVDQMLVYIISEFMEKGSLLDYLQSKNRSIIQKSHQASFAQDVCSGMAYLEERDLVHRDIAARNILLSGDNVAKVSNVEFAVKRGYVPKAMMLPIKWTAPEAIVSNEFSNKSDVWSFGILLWEVYSFGRVPYPRVPVNGVMTHIKKGGRLDCPENCPPEVYEIMKTCWYERPEDRPTFKELLEQLKALPPSDDHDGYTLTSKPIPTSEPVPTREPVPTNHPNMPKPKPLPRSKPPVGRKSVPTNETTAPDTATGTVLPVSGTKEKPWKPGTVVVARYQFKGTTAHDLPFEQGDYLTITSASRDPNWYKARREDGLEGMLPANFVMEAQVGNKELEKSKKPSSENISKAAVPLHKMPWFHGKISRWEGESKLNPKQNGLYLVRESTNFPGDYSLLVCYQNKIEHYHIKFKDNMYTIDDEEEFDNLMQLVEHYRKDADGLVTRLCVPVAKEGKQNYTVEMDDFKKFGWNIPRHSLKFGALLGEGLFGKVFIGEYKGMKVAIKSRKDDHGGLQDFLAEASIMTSLNHPNLVKLIGVSVDEKPVYIITEFMEKESLLKYLRSTSNTSVIQKSHQIGFAQNVCGGMAYLEQKDIVHRDLAARNILVSGDNIAKISDFRLARERDYDHKGVKIPIKWTAPEAIESGEFSNKSDVWSFGILLWEMYSFGRVPYLHVPLNDVMTHIKEGGRLDCPHKCPPEVYKIMKTCWYERPGDRPTFKELLEELKALPPSACQP